MDSMRRLPGPNDPKWVHKRWNDRCAWGAVRDGTDFILGTRDLPYVNARVYGFLSLVHAPRHRNSLLPLIHPTPSGEKFGGARGDTRRVCDLNKLFRFELYIRTSKNSLTSFDCAACHRRSAGMNKHTCGHVIMEGLCFATMKSEYTNQSLHLLLLMSVLLLLIMMTNIWMA